jgi:hypothetical protein
VPRTYRYRANVPQKISRDLEGPKDINIGLIRLFSLAASKVVGDGSAIKFYPVKPVRLTDGSHDAVVGGSRDPLSASVFRHLGRHLRVPHPLLAVKILQHLDRGPHVGGELEDADPSVSLMVA